MGKLLFLIAFLLTSTTQADYKPPCELLLWKNSGDLEIYGGFRREWGNFFENILKARTQAFKDAGEGGDAVQKDGAQDTDGWDDTYFHIGVWSPKENAIAGAQRVGISNLLPLKNGYPDTYSFDSQKMEPFFEYLKNSSQIGIEVGRTFVSKQFQNGFTFFYLWKGLFEALKKKNILNSALVYGVVSLSIEQLQRKNVDLIFAYINNHHMHPEFSKAPLMAKPPHEYLPPEVSGEEKKLIELSLKEFRRAFEAMSGKDFPPHLSVYLKFGSQFAGFSDCSDWGTVDGISILDKDQLSAGIEKLTRERK